MIKPARVDITARPELGTGIYMVSPVWDGVDRPNVGGTAVRGRVLADRLARAWQDGAAYDSAEIKTDIYGETYVCAGSRILAKYANADLRRLGY